MTIEISSLHFIVHSLFDEKYLFVISTAASMESSAGLTST